MIDYLTNKIFQIKPTHLILLGFFFLINIACSSRSSSQCLESLPGDSKSFGYSLAINDSYMAVGDFEANRVIIYVRNKSGRWIRTREILPPSGSDADLVGQGFGYDLSLDKSTLIIGAYAEKYEADNNVGFQDTNQSGVFFSSGVYKVSLDENADVKRVDDLDEGEIAGFSVSVEGEKIVFGTRREEEPGRWIGKVKLLENDHILTILPPTNQATPSFGVDIDLKNNRLLVGSPFDDIGAAWLFDLEKPENKPERLAIPNVHIGGSVALSDKFAVVGTPGGRTYGIEVKTLVKSLHNDSTAIIDAVGSLSLDGQYLAIMRPQSPDMEQQALLKIFELSDVTIPRLIKERGKLNQAFIQNSLVTTVEQTPSGVKLCIEKYNLKNN